MDKSAKLDLYLDFITICRSKLSVKSDVLSLILLNCRLDFADVLNELSEIDAAKGQLEKANTELGEMSWIVESDQQRQMLRKLQTDVRSVTNMDDLPARLDIAALARESGDRLLETRMLARIKLTLNQVQQIDRDSRWTSIFEANVKRYAELHSDPKGNVVLFAGGLSLLASSIGDSTSKAAEFMYQLAKFELKYPEFDIPIQSQNIWRGAARSLRILGKIEDAAAYERKTVSALLDCPWDPTQFYRSYRGKPHGDWAPYLLEIILSWIKSELEHGVISAEEVIDLLLLTHFKKGEKGEEISSSILVQEMRTLSPYILVKNLYGDPHPANAEEWDNRFQRYEFWLLNGPSNVERWIRHTVLADIQEARCASINKYLLEVVDNEVKALDEDLQLAVRQSKLREVTQLLELRKRLDPKAMGSSPEDVSTQESIVMGSRLDLATSFKAFRTEAVKDCDILEVQNWKETEFSRFQGHQKVSRLATLTSIALCMNRRYTLWGTVAPDACLEILAQYDEIYKEQRRERSILRGSENIRVRAQISSRWATYDHYSLAMGTCVEAIGAGQLRNGYHRHIHQDMSYRPAIPPAIRTSYSLFIELINWAQKRKARAITEVLGAEVIISKKVLLSFENDAYAQGMIQRERDIQEMLERGVEDLLGINEALETLRTQMREYPGLKEVMDMRDGLALTDSQIRTLGSALGPNVLIVDYVYLASSYTGLQSEILPMVYKSGHLCKASFVGQNLNYKTLKRWVRTFMEQDQPLSTEQATAALNMLSPLVETAVRFSEPGDTILISPTGLLFGIPLHAIEVAGQPLIERNPIVYTQSLAMFKLCQLSASSLDISETLNPVAIQALSDTDSALPGAASMTFVERIGAVLLTGSDLNKQTFMTAIANSSLVHFYGHVGFKEKDPLDHCLAIRDLNSESVTARDIFNMRLRSGAHISLIGCESGRSEIGSQDDLLGLSTALFYAGARSIVSALWSIQMEDGDVFQEAFYNQLLLQSAEKISSADPVGAVLDMAKALQQAVLEVSIDENGVRRAPYHWAAFTFQGCWNKFPILKRYDDLTF